MKSGYFVVIEGVDGAGKSTQIELLKKYLAQKDQPFEAISFPRYEDNIYSRLVKRYLEGEFGDIKNVNPYLMSLAYAGDRLLAKPQIEKWLHGGKLVIANRYVSSNKAHQGANLPENERQKYFEWLEKLEYGENKIPKEDLTILLNVNAKIGQQNVLTKHVPDLHENDLNHLNKANKIYLEFSKKQKNWVVVNCMKNGKMRPIGDIQKDILKILKTVIPANAGI